MSPEWVNLVPYAISALFLLALLLFLFAVFQLWRGRKTEQYRSSREADRRGRRLFLISLGMFAVVLVLSAAASFAVIAVGGIDALLGRTPSLATTPSPTLDPSLPPPVLEITAADAVITPQNTPVEPRTVFEVGIKRIYFFIRFAHMNNTMNWSRALYRDGTFLSSSNVVWNMGESGENFFFLESRSGFPSGEYELRLLVNDQPASVFMFTVKES